MTEHPYRTVTYIDRPSAIKAQMIGAVEMLREWSWWRPIIAGGALWSWAAGNLANDVDIFARSTWWSRRRAKAMYGKSTMDLATVNPRVPTGYGDFMTGEGLHVFRTQLETIPTKVDFVLSRRGQYGYGKTAPMAHSIFDYSHVQVAYSLDWYSIDGADAYCQGKLKQLHSHARDRNYVLGKVQTTLWNNPQALAQVTLVMEELAKIAGKPLSRPRRFPAYIE